MSTVKQTFPGDSTFSGVTSYSQRTESRYLQKGPGITFGRPSVAYFQTLLQRAIVPLRQYRCFLKLISVIQEFNTLSLYHRTSPLLLVLCFGTLQSESYYTRFLQMYLTKQPFHQISVSISLGPMCLKAHSQRLRCFLVNKSPQSRGYKKSEKRSF